VLIKPDGEELDRINGFDGKDEFVGEVKDYLAGNNLLSNLLAQVEANPEQEDLDGDDIGDACDICPEDPDNEPGCDATRFRRGDANEDGVLNIADAVFVLGFLFGSRPGSRCLGTLHGENHSGDGDLLGGWLKEALPIRGSRVIAYHKNWAYFSDIFGLEILDFIEPKPGIPPSAKHVQYIVNLIKEQDIKVMLVASYFEKKSPQMIEDRTGIKAVYLPLFINREMGINNNFELVDYWISQIKKNL